MRGDYSTSLRLQDYYINLYFKNWDINLYEIKLFFYRYNYLKKCKDIQ